MVTRLPNDYSSVLCNMAVLQQLLFVCLIIRLSSSAPCQGTAAQPAPCECGAGGAICQIGDTCDTANSRCTGKLKPNTQLKTRNSGTENNVSELFLLRSYEKDPGKLCSFEVDEIFVDFAQKWDTSMTHRTCVVLLQNAF